MVETLIAKLGLFVISVISAMGYLGVMLLMAIESACIPLPSEVIMPFSGYLVYTGQFNLWIVALMGAIGCNVGSAVAYEVGYFGGRRLVERYGRPVVLIAIGIKVIDRGDKPSSPLAQRSDSLPSQTVAAAIPTSASVSISNASSQRR